MRKHSVDTDKLEILRQARATHAARRALRRRFLDNLCIIMVLPPHIRASVPMATFAREPLADWMLRPGRNGDAELPDSADCLS